jgi:hypothetical protein
MVSVNTYFFLEAAQDVDGVSGLPAEAATQAGKRVKR